MPTSFVVIWTCQHKITRPCKHYCNIQGVHRRFCASKMADSRFIMEMHYCSHFWRLRPSFVRKLHYWVLNLWSYRAYKLQCWFSRKSLLPVVKGEHTHFGADSLVSSDTFILWDITKHVLDISLAKLWRQNSQFRNSRWMRTSATPVNTYALGIVLFSPYLLYNVINPKPVVLNIACAYGIDSAATPAPSMARSSW